MSLFSLFQRLANLQKSQSGNNKVKSKQQDRSKQFGLYSSNNSLANTPQEYSNDLKSFPSRSPSQGDEDSALILTQDNLKSSDPDLSANSDQESGVEDLSCRSPSGGGCLPSEDSGKDSDEAVFLAGWNALMAARIQMMQSITQSGMASFHQMKNGSGLWPKEIIQRKGTVQLCK